MNDLTHFLNTLFSGQQGFAYAPSHRKSGAWVQEFFQLPHRRDHLESWLLTECRDADVYLSPSLFRVPNSKKENVLGSQVVWVEFDGKQQINLSELPIPTMVIQSSSEFHLHIYWRVPFSPPGAIENVNRRLTYGLEADTSGWDANQLLRPPMTFNWKYAEKIETKLVSINVANPVGLSSFDSIKEPPPLVPITNLDNLPTLSKVLSSYILNDKAKELFNTDGVEVGYRSTALMNLGYLLAEAGMKRDEIVSVLLDADDRIKKFYGRTDQLIRITEIASKAFGKYGGAISFPLLSPQQLLDIEESLDFVWGRLLPVGGNLMLTGRPGVGKTQLATQFAFYTAIEKPLMGHATRGSKILILSFEMPSVGLKEFIRRQRLAFTDDEWGLISENVMIYAPGESLPLNDIYKLLSSVEIGGVVIDSLGVLSTRPLIDEEEAKRLMNWDTMIRNSLGIFTVYIHHNRKQTAAEHKPVDLNDVYGSYVFGQRFDSILCLWKDVKGKGDHENTQLIGLKARYSGDFSADVQRDDENFIWSVMTGEQKTEAKNQAITKAGDIGIEDLEL